MTIAELLLAVCVGVGAYKALRPLQRWIESGFLRLFGRGRKVKFQVIDKE